jgi:hypothetical protein
MAELRDGKEYERNIFSMIERFDRAHDGVPVQDIEAAIRAERRGNTKRLDDLLARRLTTVSGRDQRLAESA